MLEFPEHSSQLIILAGPRRTHAFEMYYKQIQLRMDWPANNGELEERKNRRVLWDCGLVVWEHVFVFTFKRKNLKNKLLHMPRAPAPSPCVPAFLPFNALWAAKPPSLLLLLRVPLLATSLFVLQVFLSVLGCHAAHAVHAELLALLLLATVNPAIGQSQVPGLPFVMAALLTNFWSAYYRPATLPSYSPCRGQPADLAALSQNCCRHVLSMKHVLKEENAKSSVDHTL